MINEKEKNAQDRINAIEHDIDVNRRKIAALDHRHNQLLEHLRRWKSRLAQIKAEVERTIR